MQPQPFGQSLPDVHVSVQTPGGAHAKLHAEPAAHGRPMSLIKQTLPPPGSSQWKPAAHCELLVHDRVQRLEPAFVIARQWRPAVHSLSLAQRSSSPFPVMPLPVEALDVDPGPDVVVGPVVVEVVVFVVFVPVVTPVLPAPPVSPWNSQRPL